MGNTRGAWRGTKRRGAWQEQSVAYAGTPSDTITLSDSPTLEAGIAAADSLTLSDVQQTADSRVVNTGTEDSGSLSDTYTQNAVHYNIGETAGTPGTQITFTHTVNGVGRSFSIYGRYDGNPGHTVVAEAYNGSGWDILAGGNWASAGVDHLQTWTLLPSHTIGGSIQTRVTHQTGGNPTHDFFFDHVYVTDGADSVTGVLSMAGAINDTITLSDAVLLAAAQAITDTISLADAVTQVAAQAIQDTITLSDLASLGLQGEISDTITLTDSLTQAVAKAISDTITLIDAAGIGLFGAEADTIGLVDSVALAVATEIVDSLSLSDVVALVAGSTPADSLSLVDSISGVIGQFFDDTLTITDQISLLAAVLLEDTVNLSDGVSGTLTYGFTTPGTADVTNDTEKGARVGNESWTKNVTNEPSPITAYSKSSAGTTFTSRGVVDASAWDLTEAEVGDLAVTQDGYTGVIKTIASNSILVPSWIKGGVNRRGTAEDYPSNGQTVTLHKMLRCDKVVIRSLGSNTDDVYVGINDPSVDSLTGHPVSNVPGQANSQVTLKAPRDRWLNLGKVWVSAGTPQQISISVGFKGTVGGTGMAGRLADSIGLSDNVNGILTVVPGVSIGDTLSLSDDVTSEASALIQDSITIADDLNMLAALSLADAIALADQAGGIGPPLADGLSLSDEVSGVLDTGVTYPPSPPIQNDVVVVGNYAYTSCVHGTDHGLCTWDVTNKAAPVKVHYLHLWVDLGYSSPGKIAVDANGRDYIYVGMKDGISDDRLISIDISAPAVPTVADDLNLDSESNFHWDIKTYASRLYMATVNDGIRIVNLDDPTAMSLVVGFPYYNSQAVADNHDPMNPPEWDWHHPWDLTGGNPVHNYTFDGNGRLDLNANFLCIGEQGRLWWFDRSDAPDVQTLTPATVTPNAGSTVSAIVLAGNTAHVHATSMTSTHQAYSYMKIGQGPAAYPSANGYLGTQSIQSETYWKAELSGSYAYFTIRSNRVVVVDTATGSVAYTYSTPGRSFTIDGNYLYHLHWAVGAHSLDIHDITTPLVPVLTGVGTF